jgi:hypothetical protein
MTMTLTNTTTLLPTSHTAAGAGISGIDPANTGSHRSIPAYRLPRRFDVHQVERVTADISALAPGAPLSIDGTDVEMIDLSALAALDELADVHDDMRFVAPSVALRATMAYTGHDRLTARCTTSTVFAAAA